MHQVLVTVGESTCTFCIPVLTFDIEQIPGQAQGRHCNILIFAFRQGKMFYLCIVYSIDSHIIYQNQPPPPPCILFRILYIGQEN